MKSKPYASPYLMGVGLGLVLLAAFFFTGHGLGASGAITRSIVAVEKVVAPQHVNNNGYWKKYGGGEKNPLDSWLIFEVLGVVVGGLVSGAMTGRLKKETNKGNQISNKQRWMFAVLGGALFGFGAKMARGCTSGLILSGGATLSLGAWIAIVAMFGAAYATAFFVKKLWI
jgi:uncharacterized membrane protein YedE/YeeE